MAAEEKSIDLSEIEMEKAQFELSHASILLDERRNDTNSQTRKETGNDTANVETRCDKKSELALGSFMKDLERFEKDATFESDAYDIYHNTTNSMWRYKHKANQILDSKASKEQNKQLS